MAKKGTKDVKVTYHTISTVKWKQRGKKPKVGSDADEDSIAIEDVKKSNPFYEIEDIIGFIMAKKLVKRIYTFKNDKFGYIDYAITTKINDNIIDIKLCFESARNEFRPQIIDKITGVKKQNPRQRSESDINKSHLLIRIDRAQEEVFVYLEYYCPIKQK